MNDYLVPSGMIPISDLDLGIDESVTFPTSPSPTPDGEEEKPIEEEIVEEEIIEDIIEEEQKSKIMPLLSFEEAKKQLKLRKKDATTKAKANRK